jgi:NhaP-type Na+/H+ or K+/H+ antiporter
MTVVGILLPATGLKNPLTYISHNLFYNISYGIISGFFIGILASKLIQKCASHFS